MEDKDFLALVKKVLEEQTKPKQVPVEQELKKWKKAGYTHTAETKNTHVLQNKKGKDLHQITIHHKDGMVTHNEPLTLIRKPSEEMKKDVEHARKTVEAIKSKRRKMN